MIAKSLSWAVFSKSSKALKTADTCGSFLNRFFIVQPPATEICTSTKRSRRLLLFKSALEKTVRNRVFSIDAATLRQLTCYMHARHALADALLPPCAPPHLRPAGRQNTAVFSPRLPSTHDCQPLTVDSLLTLLECALARLDEYKPFRMRTYEKRGGYPPPFCGYVQEKEGQSR